MHGGGMITGNAWSVLPRLLREWAATLELAVVSVEYRLAPEARYPAAVEDCYAGLVWVAAHAAELGIDAGRVVVGGKSAGGGLAAALALLTRDRGEPCPVGQLLLCPMLDDRNDTFSSRQMAGIDTWDRTSNATAWQAVLGDRYGAADLPPYAAPARATDLSGLPPAYVEVGSAETLRDEAVAYAQALWRAGGQVELHVWPGGCHGFDTFAPRAALTRTPARPVPAGCGAPSRGREDPVGDQAIGEVRDRVRSPVGERPGARVALAGRWPGGTARLARRLPRLRHLRTTGGAHQDTSEARTRRLRRALTRT
jgi:acetyl esterase/lipase